MFALLAAFVCTAGIAIPLAAQDVTIMPPVLFEAPADSSEGPYQPDTPPALRTNCSPVFPVEMRTTTEPGYVIVTQRLDKNGERTNLSAFSSNEYYEKSVRDWSSNLQYTPAQKNAQPAASSSWIGVIYNPAGASETNANAIPRILKVAPIPVAEDQWNAFPNGPRVIRGTIEIDTAGTAKNLRLESSASFAQAVRPAIESSFAQWQFAPARKEGRPVDATLTLGFSLGPAPFTFKSVAAMRAGLPMPIKKIAPKYPQSMKNSGMVGEVRVQVVVDVDGRVRSPMVVHSNNPNFDQPAIDAILQWRYKPATKDGKPVEFGGLTVPIQFTPAD